MSIKPSFQRSVYFSGEKSLGIVDAALKIAKRESWGFNRLILESLTEFVRRHGEANTSYTLDLYGGGEIRALPVERGKLTMNHVSLYPEEEISRLLKGAIKEVEVLEEALKQKRPSPENAEHVDPFETQLEALKKLESISWSRVKKIYGKAKAAERFNPNAAEIVSLIEEKCDVVEPKKNFFIHL